MPQHNHTPPSLLIPTMEQLEPLFNKRAYLQKLFTSLTDAISALQDEMQALQGHTDLMINDGILFDDEGDYFKLQFDHKEMLEHIYTSYRSRFAELEERFILP